jgi:very-short-patch-repair endonuclease
VAPYIFFICLFLVASWVGNLMHKSDLRKKETKIQNTEKQKLFLKSIEINGRRSRLKIELPKILDKHYPLYFHPIGIIKAKPELADWRISEIDFVQDNHKEYKGFKPKRGKSEKDFLYVLNEHFPGYINTDYQVGKYYPDFIFYDNAHKLGICIEIDEQTTTVGIFTRNIHGEENIPSPRTLFLQNNGYAVVRFTENQVKNQPNECCHYLGEIARFITTDFKYTNIFSLPNKAIVPEKCF